MYSQLVIENDSCIYQDDWNLFIKGKPSKLNYNKTHFLLFFQGRRRKQKTLCANYHIS